MTGRRAGWAVPGTTLVLVACLLPVPVLFGLARFDTPRAASTAEVA
jgi:hypothetical protein